MAGREIRPDLDHDIATAVEIENEGVEFVGHVASPAEVAAT
jgi:hypothetical protein